MRIFIPTMGRPRQRTLERLPHKIHWLYKTTLVCPRGEGKKLQQLYTYVKVVEIGVKGIAATRQAIIDMSPDPIVLMLDDDLPTWCARIVGTNRYRKAEDDDIINGFDEFARMMKKFAHGAIGHRLFCQNHPSIYYNGRMLRALAYNKTLWPKGVKFRLQVMEDFDMALQLLTAGRDGLIYNALVQDQYATNSEGGCSTYRTQELQTKCANELAANWPDYVTLVKRAPKREWEGFGKERVDVRVNWRRAATTGGCKQLGENK